MYENWKAMLAFEQSTAISGLWNCVIFMHF